MKYLTCVAVLCTLLISDNADASFRSRRTTVVVNAPGTRVVVNSRRGFGRPRNQVNVFVR
jgi:hypothetical protein